jgi:5-methylcytosine-specific restriction enzyme B
MTELKNEGGKFLATWFVGASYGGTDDQSPRFLANGIWEVDAPTDKERALVNAMSIGDRIAIKATYVRKHGLPFDNRDHPVSVLAIKAVGTITGNPRDGERVEVKWNAVDPPREWYFYTYRGTIWRVLPGEWTADGLIAFAFDNKSQDIDRFRDAPFWRDRFGTTASSDERFAWTRFYEAIATALLKFRTNRAALVDGLKDISARVEGLGHLRDQLRDGTEGFVRDICPFTTIGLVNRGLTPSKRKAIAGELAKFLGVDVPPPGAFEGVPLLDLRNSWFFPYEKDREKGHIDSLWSVFAAAIDFADSDTDTSRAQFAKAFDDANGRLFVAWNLTFGLYWIRPWSFVTLDAKSQVYLTKKLRVPIGLHGPKNRCNSGDYLTLMDLLESRFQESDYPVHSYPELSFAAWQYKDPTASEPVPGGKGKGEEEEGGAGDEGGGEKGDEQGVEPLVPYSVDDIVKDGCFLARSEIERMLERLRVKKNLILQGPPGTGKTWLAKRLAFALMGQKDESKVRAVQFHPNLSYEDFVRGWRPSGEGKLKLADGVFMEAITAASKESSSKVVVVIEEINRGNPAQIFGEMLTLLEAGKRTPSEALELCYPDADGIRRPVHIPEKLYVIGTMNIADRSLALVDLALRRRFAFVGLEPRLGSVWRNWVVSECGIDPGLVDDIERRITELNGQIAMDAKLGAQFRIGHSYVTPVHRLEVGETKKWFREVVETEIGPLLEEYWFDSSDEAQKACARLLQEW